MEGSVTSLVDNLVESAASESASKSGGVVAGGLGAWAAVEEGVSTASADASESAKYDGAYWEAAVRTAVDAGDVAAQAKLVVEMDSALFRLAEESELGGSSPEGLAQSIEAQKDYLRVKMLKAEGEATLQKKAWLEVEQRAYEERNKIAAKDGEGGVKLNLRAESLQEEVGDDMVKVRKLEAYNAQLVEFIKAQGFEPPSKGGSTKIDALRAEGEARIAARKEMAEAQKVYELTAAGGKTIANREAMSAAYEQAKKIQDLTAEGAARIAAREEMADVQKVYALAQEGAAVVEKRMGMKGAYEQAAKIQGLTAEGAARIAAREEIAQSDKIYKLRAEGEARVGEWLGEWYLYATL